MGLRVYDLMSGLDGMAAGAELVDENGNEFVDCGPEVDKDQKPTGRFSVRRKADNVLDDPRPKGGLSDIK